MFFVDPVLRSATHPADITPGTETLAVSRENDKANRFVVAQLFERFGKRVDQDLVHRIVKLRAIEADARNPPAIGFAEYGCLTHRLHPEDAKLGVLRRRIESSRKPKAQNHPRIGGRDDTVVPQTGG